MSLENFKGPENKPDSKESPESPTKSPERSRRHVVDMFEMAMGPEAVLDEMKERKFKFQPSSERMWWNESQ